MGAGPQTIGGIVGVLNEVNTKHGVFKLFSEGTFTMDILEKGDQGSPKAITMQAEVDGRYVKIQLQTGGNPNVGTGVREGGQYPLAGSQSTAHLKYRTERLVACLAMTTEVMLKAKFDAQAVYKVAAKEITDIMSNCRKRENLYCLMDGSALFATATAWNNGTKVLTVDDVSKFQVGMEVVARSKQGGVAKGLGPLPTNWTLDVNGAPYPAKITVIDTVNKTITLTYFNAGAIGDITAGGTSVVNMGVYPADSQGSVPYGLDSFCTTGNPSAHGYNPAALPSDETGMLLGYGGVDRTVVTGFQANTTKDLKNAPLSVKDWLEPEEIELVTREPSLFNEDACMVISPGRQFHQVVHNLEAGKRTYTRTRIKEGRWEVVRSGIFTFGWDPDCPAKTMFFFAPKFFFRMELEGWGFEDLGGSMYNQQLGGIGRPTGVWQLNAYTYKQLLCGSCRGNGKWTNVGP